MKWRSFCSITVVFLALIGVSIMDLQSQPISKKSNDPTQSHSDQTATTNSNPKDLSASIVTDVQNKTERNTVKKEDAGKEGNPAKFLSRLLLFLKSHWYEIAISLFTLIVAIFTGLLYKATSGLWDVAKRQSEDLKESIAIAKETAEATKIQAQTMRDELTLKHRAKIHVRDVVIPYFEDPYGKGEFLKGRLSIVNLGGVYAHIVNIGAWFEIGYEKGFPTEMPDESEKPNIPDPHPIRLEAGQSGTYEFIDKRTPWGPSHDSIRRGMTDYTLFVIGYVSYTDATGFPRYTRFFREYRLPKDQAGLPKTTKRRFLPVEGYEYQE